MVAAKDDEEAKTGTTLAEFIRRHRRALHMSKAELSRRIGVSPGYMTHIEAGRRRNLSQPVIARLARELEVPVADLLRLVDNPPADVGPTPYASVEAAVRADPALDDEQRRVLLAVYEQMRRPKRR